MFFPHPVSATLSAFSAIINYFGKGISSAFFFIVFFHIYIGEPPYHQNDQNAWIIFVKLSSSGPVVLLSNSIGEHVLIDSHFRILLLHNRTLW
jgi:hypothetical protein